MQRAEPASSRRGARPGPRLRWRAVVGAALVTIAAGGVVFAHRAAQRPPSERWVVAVAEVPAGRPLRTDDLGTVAIDLPEGIDAVPARRAQSVVGRVTAHPLGRSALLRESDLLEEGRFRDPEEVEVAVSLDPARVPLGAFGPGDTVHLLRTSPEGDTTALTSQARVVQVGDGGDGDGIGGSASVRVRLTLPDIGAAIEATSAAVAAELTVALPAPSPDGSS
jgi:hypothetical protein